MLIRITLLLVFFNRLGFAQTIPEMLFLGVLQGASQIDFNGHPPEPAFHNGLIIINSDTIKGQIKVSSSKVYFFNDSVKKAFKNHSFIRKASGIIFSPFVNNNPKKNFIKTKEVTSVRLFAADTLITKNNHMDFIHIGNSPRLCRRIYSGSLEIFDYSNTTDETPGYIAEELVVLDNGKIIPPSNSSAKIYLVNCINKKFNKDYKTSDFKRRIDVIYWLKCNDINSVDDM